MPTSVTSTFKMCLSAFFTHDNVLIMRINLMRIAGYILFLLAFASYAKLVQTIRQLVAQARQVGSDARFNWFWWTPAWRVGGMATIRVEMGQIDTSYLL